MIGNRVHLKVRPEVSTLDFNNAIVLQGFRIPALATRRTETEIELENGQTFAIAGLLNNTMNSTMQKIPGIGDIPILGLLFKSKAAQKNQTELVVMITPEILPQESVGVTAELPRLNEPFLPLPELKKTLPSPPPAFTVPPPAAGPGNDGAARAADPVPAPAVALAPNNAAAAAAALSALTPHGPTSMPAPVASAAAAGDTSASIPPVAVRPDDLQVLERTRREETRGKLDGLPDRGAAARVAKDAAKEAAKEAATQADIQRRNDEAAKKQQEKTAREQAKRDAEAAKRATEAARRQAERDAEQQKLIDEAAAKLEAAQLLYNDQVAKKNSQ